MATLQIALTDDMGQPVDEGNSLSVEPRFYGRGYESAPCVMLEVKDADGVMTSRYNLVVRGTDLTLKLVDRFRPVVPSILRKKRTKAAPSPNPN